MPLPTVADLLESPPLKFLSERFQRNVLVETVQSFLAGTGYELEELRDRPAEMAQRIAAWIDQREATGATRVVNASGVLFPEELANAPLPLASARAAALSSGSFLRRSAESSARTVGRQAAQAVGAEDGVVTASFAAGLALLLSGHQGRPWLVARGETCELAGRGLPEWASLVGAELTEVGWVNRATVEDFDARLPTSAGALRILPRGFELRGGTSPGADALIACCRQRQAPLIEIQELGGLAPLDAWGLEAPSAHQAISAGADAVLIPGDGLWGGPACGVIVGRSEMLDRLAKTSWFVFAAANDGTAAAAAAAIAACESPERMRRELPLAGLLATRPENLRLRAERIAQQIAASPRVRGVDLFESPARLTSPDLERERIASCQLSVETEGVSAADLADSLRKRDPAILGRVAGDRLILDLRGVFPWQDALLVAALDDGS